MVRDKDQDIAMIHSSKKIIVLIVSIGLLGAAILVTTMKTALRASNPATVKRSIWVGDILPALPNYSWEEHDRSLVLAARVDCQHCKASIPFYRQLQSMVASKANRVGVIAVFPNPLDKVREFLDQFHLNIPAVSSMPLQRLAVSGTPTLILVDSKGTVVRVWIGELDAEEQRGLFAQLRSYLDEKVR
jgi:hypothetical protein